MKRVIAFAALGAVVVMGGCGSCGSSSSTHEEPDGSEPTPQEGGLADGATPAGEGGASGHDAATISGEAGAADSGTDGGTATVPTPPPDYLWYVLDETTGTTAHDSSPNENDITNLDNVTWSEGANFDGSNGNCGYATVDEQYRTPPITLTGWVTPQLRSDQTVDYALYPYPPNALSNDVPGVGGYGFGINVWSNGNGGSALAAEGVSPCTQGGLCVANSTQNAEAEEAGVDGGLSCFSATSCNQGFVAAQQYFLVVTVGPVPDGGTMPVAQLYVNGQLFDQTTAYVPPAETSSSLYLGCHNMDNGYGTERVFDGRLRDMRVYLRSLGQPEIAQLYTNGPTLHAPPRPDAGSTDAASE